MPTPPLRATSRQAPLLVTLFVVCLASLGAIPRPSAANAQEPIRSRVACPDCELSVKAVTELGRDSQSLITQNSTACRGRDDRYYVGGLIDPGVFAVYDSSGSLIEEVGRRGRGPTEFYQVANVVCSGENRLQVIDRGNARVSVRDYAGRVISEHPLQLSGLEVVVALPNGHIAVNGRLQTDQSVGSRIHVLRPDGSVQWSADASADGDHLSNPVSDRRVLAAAPDGGVWAAHMNQYRIDLWSSKGRLLRTITRDANWFQPWEGLDPGEPFLTRPKPRILSMAQDQDGYLWISVMVPSRRWQPGGPEVRGLGFPGIAAYDPKWDSIIEVIDVEQSRLLYAGRMEGIGFQLLGDDLAFRPREAEGGTHYLQVVRMTVSPPSGF